MSDYIATFYSHFGAMRFKKELKELGIVAELMPVPRFLSSSCGTCAAFKHTSLPDIPYRDEIEQIVVLSSEDDNNYSVLWRNDE